MTKPNPIEVAVAPLKDDAMESARQRALADVGMVANELSKHGGDVNACAPYPKTSWNLIDYYKARFRYDLFHKVTTVDPERHYQSLRPGQPYYVVVAQPRADRYVDDAVKQAAADYDAFVRKLVAKIGPVKSAVLAGNHVWSYSILTVVTKAGETQVWQTQQITNYSKHGRAYTQWPTRKLKRAPLPLR